MSTYREMVADSEAELEGLRKPAMCQEGCGAAIRPADWNRRRRTCGRCRDYIAKAQEVAETSELGQRWRAAVEGLSLPPATRALWLEPLVPVRYAAGELLLWAPLTISAWVERRYAPMLETALSVQTVRLATVGELLRGRS